jgi:hypothetical protein
MSGEKVHARMPNMVNSDIPNPRLGMSIETSMWLYICAKQRAQEVTKQQLTKNSEMLIENMSTDLSLNGKYRYKEEQTPLLNQ